MPHNKPAVENAPSQQARILPFRNAQSALSMPTQPSSHSSSQLSSLALLWRLFQVELLKTRRSLALLMMLACPLMVVLLNLGMLLKSGNLGNPGNADKLWSGFWLGNLALWSYFMLPLYIALVTALLNGNEHKHQTWRLMLTLPISPRQLFFIKALLAGCLIAGANICLMLFCALAIAVLGLSGISMQAAYDFPLLLLIAKLTLASLPVLLIQHYLSWRVSNIVAPLALGVCATMGILQLGNSQYWAYFPWSYPLMASNGSALAMQTLAIELALALTGVFAMLTWVLIGKQRRGS